MIAPPSSSTNATATTSLLSEPWTLMEVVASLPGAYLLLTPSLHIAAVSDAYLAASFTTRAQLLGRSLFEAFPGAPGTPEDATMTSLRASLAQVLATGQPQRLAVQHYDVPDPAAPGQVVARYWEPTNTPIRDAQGTVTGIVHSVVNVTERVRAEAEQALARAQVQTLHQDLTTANADLQARHQESLTANTALRDTQQQLRQLNEALEDRVEERTRQVRQAQAEAERQRQEYYQVFEQAPVVIALLRGPAHVVQYCNPAFRALFPGRDFSGRRYAEVMPEIVAAGLIAELDRVYATGQLYYGIAHPLVTLSAADGAPHQRYYDFSYQPYREGDRLVGVAIFAYDVTEQVLARREREIQQHLVETVFAQAPTAIWVVSGPTYVFELVNPLMEQILGRSQAQLLGRPYLDALPELVSQGLPALLRQAWQGETVFIKELPAQLAYHTAPETGYFNFVFQPLRDAQGLVTRLACVAVDVSDQVLARQQVQGLNAELSTANEELHQSNANLTRTNVDLDTFVYTASHDLKAPITNIDGLLLALQEHLPATVQAEPLVGQLLGMMRGAVERFCITLDQLTNVSRLQHAQQLPAEQVPLAAVVDDVRLDLMPQLTAADTQLTIAIEPGLTVLFTPKNLRSVVYNLLSNAVKYARPGHPPVVSLRATPWGATEVELMVQDNGLGLSEGQQQQLFGLFQRLHTHVEGTGVGLYMVKRMVENAGGTVAVQSAVGVGSTFTVRLRR